MTKTLTTHKFSGLCLFDLDGTLVECFDVDDDRALRLMTERGLCHAIVRWQCGYGRLVVYRPMAPEFITSLVNRGWDIAIWSLNEPGYVTDVIMQNAVYSKLPWKFLWSGDEATDREFKDLRKVAQRFPEYEVIVLYDDDPRQISRNRGFGGVTVPRSHLTNFWRGLAKPDFFEELVTQIS